MKNHIVPGYIALLTVLVLFVFSISLLLVSPYLSIGGAQQALVLSQSESLVAVLDGCREDAFLLGVRDESYVGHSQEYFGAQCEVVVEKNDIVWNFSVVATRDGITRSLLVETNRLPGSPGTLTVVGFLEE